MKKLLQIIFISSIILILNSTINSDTTYANSAFTPNYDEARLKYSELYNNYMNLKTGELSKSNRGGDVAQIKVDRLSDSRLLYYGNGSSLKKRYQYITSSSNRLVKDVTQAVAEGRYNGLSNSITPSHSSSFEFDYCTTGNTKNRKYRALKSNGTASFSHSKVRPISTSFTNTTELTTFIEENEGFYERNISASALLYEWKTTIYDKYSSDERIRHHAGTSKCWTRGYDTTDHFKKYFTNDQKSGFVYVAQPPTQFADGLAYVFYDEGGFFYDMHPLTYYEGNTNLTATNLTADTTGSLTNLTFTVKNTGGSSIAAKTSIPIEVIVNDEVISTTVKFPSVWQVNESKTVTVFGVSVPKDSNRVSIEVNQAFGDTSANADFSNMMRVLTEDNFNYDDNIRTITVKPDNSVCYSGTNSELCPSAKELVTICKANLRGSNFFYGNASYNSDGSFSGCSYNSGTLTHEAKIVENTKSKALVGAWSSNSKGHLKYANDTAIKEATSSVTVRAYSGKSLYLTLNNVTSHKIKGVSKLKRVIRAGRDVSMYGTLYIAVTNQSTTSNADAVNKRNALINDVIAKLKVEGIEVESRAGIVTGNNNKATNQAQVDTKRSTTGKADVQVISTKATTYGSSRCGQVTVYTNKSWSILPIVTKNIGGSQATKQGDFVVTKDYQVNTTETTKYYTNLNTKNGKHSLRFATKLDMSKLDSAISTSVNCYTAPEKFAIQGNIYDDIQVEDVTDEINTVDWDF